MDNSPDGPVFDAMWTAAAKKYGWKQVKMPPYPATATEFGSLIQKLKESGADYVSPWATRRSSSLCASRWTPPGTSPRSWTSPAAHSCSSSPTRSGRSPTASFIESYWLPELPYPGAADVGKRYIDETGQSMGQILGPEYAAGQIMFDAIDRAGTTDPQKIVDAIAATSGDFVCGPVKFNDKHVSAIPVIWTQWQDQKSVIVWPADVATAEAIFPLP